MKNRAVLEKLITTALGALAVWGLSALGMECISISLFGIPCPGCGITRAIMSILRWDWASAMKYNSGVVLLPVFYLYYWMDGKVIKNKTWNKALLIGAGALFLLRYILSLLW